MNKRKNKRRMLSVSLLFISMCLTACGKKLAEDPYGNSTFIADLSDEGAYAFLVTENDYTILVTSELIYDDGTENQASTYCDVYYYFDGKAKHLGSITSEGTAYPLSFSKEGIFAASGHGVEKYVISDKDGQLHLEKAVYETFDESGNPDYTGVEDGKETASTENAYLELLEEYAKSQTIHFSYGASGCLNEILEFKTF